MAEVMRSTQDEAVQLLKEVSGRYVVLAEGQTIIETGVLSAAEIYYEEEVERRKSKSREILVRERAHVDTQAILSGSSARRSLHARRKGGKGGKGGV
jgi:hypothetical protein